MKTYEFKDCTLSIAPPRARGRALTLIARDRMVTRKWFERIPILDRWLRRRLTVTIRHSTSINYREVR